MAVRKKQSKFQKFMAEKGKWAVLSLVIFALIGIIALVVGFAIRDGWLSVLQWFGSRWAIYCYIGLAILVLLLVWVFHQNKMRE